MNALPPTLIRFEVELERAIRSELAYARSRRRRRLGLGLVGSLAAVAMIALGILTVLPGREPAVVHPAAAQSIVRRAAVALTLPSGTILHVDLAGRQLNGDGSVVRWHSESWQQNAAPYAQRQVETGPDGRTVETAVADSVLQLYDPARNTIYTNPPKPPPLDIRPGPRPGTYVIRVPNVSGKIVERVIIGDPEDLQGLRQDPTQERPETDPFRKQALALLNSGHAHVNGHITLEGRAAIRIVSGNGHATYVVDARTYDPLELRTTGAGGGTILRFRAYEKLAPTHANEALLSLAAAHPGATVDRSSAAYQAAYSRLFPGG
jgi:hypothetical protein